MTKITVLGSCVSRVSLLDGIQSEHGVCDIQLDIDYYLDKQNIVCAMTPPPFSREEVDNFQDICIREKGAIRSLRQNLNKETLSLLLASDAEYLVIDFMDMQMNQCRYGNTIFAPQANEFFRTNLYEKYEKDIQKFRIYDQPWDEWIGYVDEFFSYVMKKYDSNHIILNRFQCTAYYWDTEGRVRYIPRRFRGSSHPLPRFNDTAKKFEQYIIDRYQPWVIDLSKYFMGDNNVWENLQGAHFEREFYRETFDQIRRIIFGQTNERYFSIPQFFNHERRGYVEDLLLPFDIEDGIMRMYWFYEKNDLLWLNILDKLYMRVPDDKRVKKMLKQKRNQIINVVGSVTYEKSNNLWNF